MIYSHETIWSLQKICKYSIKNISSDLSHSKLLTDALWPPKTNFMYIPTNKDMQPQYNYQIAKWIQTQYCQLIIKFHSSFAKCLNDALDSKRSGSEYTYWLQPSYSFILLHSRRVSRSFLTFMILKHLNSTEQWECKISLSLVLYNVFSWFQSGHSSLEAE